MKLNYTPIIEEKHYLKHRDLIPKELKNHINSLKKIPRFQLNEYPKGVIKDSTKEHTLKCIHLANTINFKIQKKKLIRTLWIHDIPELIIKDITVIEKNRKPRLSEELDNQEVEAAKILLNETDRELLTQFNKAYEILKGKEKWTGQVPLEMLLGKIIDNTDGNITFHYFVSKWTASSSYKKEEMFPMDSLEYSFLTNRKFSKFIKAHFPKEQQEILLHFIDVTLENIHHLWKNVPEKRIPKELKKHLQT